MSIYKWGDYDDNTISACINCYEGIMEQFSESVVIDQYHGNCDTNQHYHPDIHNPGDEVPYLKIGQLISKTNLTKWKFTNSARLRILKLFREHFSGS